MIGIRLYGIIEGDAASDEFIPRLARLHTLRRVMAHTITNPAGLHDPVGFGYSHIVSAPASDIVFIAASTLRTSRAGLAQRISPSR